MREISETWPNPQPNSVNYFASAVVLELTKDRAWLARNKGHLFL